MVATARELEDKLDQVISRMETISKTVIPFIEKQQGAISSGKQGTLELRNASGRIDEFAKQLLGVQKEHNELKASLNARSARDQERSIAGRTGGVRGSHLRAAIEDDPRFAHFCQQVKERSNNNAASGQIEIKNWFRPGVDYIPGQVRQSNAHRREVLLRHLRGTDLNTSTTAPIVTPEYIEEILMQPRPVSVVRQLVGSRQTAATNKVIRYREVTRPLPGSTITAAVIATDTTAILTSVVGLLAQYPFNKVKIGTEDVVISNIDTATKVITFAPPLAGPWDIGTEVAFTAITQTTEGVLKPGMVGDLGPYEIPLVVLADTRPITNQALQDITGITQYIDAMGPLLLAEIEELNFLYGPGGIAAITGLFIDSAIPTLAEWSSFAIGTTLWDYIVKMFYTLAKKSVFAQTILMSVERHETLAQLTGSDGHYIWNINRPEGAPAMAFVGEILWSPQLQEADIMAGDFSIASNIYDRQQANTSFGLNGNDFSNNMITARFEERVGLGTELPIYLLKGDADAAPS